MGGGREGSDVPRAVGGWLLGVGGWWLAGDWNYDGTNLTPASGDGEYKMANVEKIVHRYIHKIPCCGTVPYFTMSSDETTELPAGYFLRITAHNVSLTTWNASVIVEIYRERTFVP